MSEYRKANRDKVVEIKRKYRNANKNEITIYQREYRRNNLQARLSKNLRNKMRKVFKGIAKSVSAMSFIGCTIEELKAHLEGQFQDGMTWDNYGFYGWHIDHIRPCASFDMSDPKQKGICFHYTNLQPLWAKDNFRKGHKGE